MIGNFNQRFFEPERMSRFMSWFYNFLPARILFPTYQQIVDSLDLENKGVLIDIGTGPGILAEMIAEKYPELKVVGIDLSGPMVKIARKKRKPLANLEFKLMSAKNLLFPEKSVDYVISTFSLHHWKEPLLVLDEIYRVLKTGGAVWIYDGSSEASGQDFKEGFKAFWGIRIPNGIMRKVFSQHGFYQEEYESYLKPLIAKSSFKAGNFNQCGIVFKIEFKK